MSGEELVYAAALQVLERGFVQDDSVFTPGRAIWTQANARELASRLAHPSAGAGSSFLDKLRSELAGAGLEVVQLAAELIYFHLLPGSVMKGTTKRVAIRGVFGGMDGAVRLPADLDAALDSGVLKVGVAYNTYRAAQVTWLAEVVAHLKNEPEQARSAFLADPWVLRELLDQLPNTTAAGQRRALLHLAFPDVFLNSLRADHPAAIMQAFSDQIEPLPASGDIEIDFAAFWQAMRAKYRQPVNFFQSPWREQWLAAQQDSEPAASSQPGWLVRGANVAGKNLVPDWLRDGYCALSLPDYGAIAPGLSRIALAKLVRETEPGLSPNQEGARVTLLDRFFNRMKVGDLVVTVNEARVYAGFVTGEPAWAPESPLADRRRAVRWLNAERPFPRADLSDTARDRLSGQLAISDLGETRTEILQLIQVVTGDDEAPEDLGAVDVDDLPLSAAADQHLVVEVRLPLKALPVPGIELADELLVEPGWLAETMDLLNEKKHLVLYGPPGTGKTYLAQALARFAAEQTDGDHRLVQFHPSYAYEDFVEGFRPSTAGGESFRFAKEHGPFRRLVAAAAGNPSGAYVLVIDEINRANLAKVFGELYFLLEYRDRTIQLQYSPDEDFVLPANVFLIGTMNTADRSIALVDAAMRRRFAWQGLFPSVPPVREMLRRWLTRQGLPAYVADLLDALNAEIADRDAAVGPSYLMNRRVDTELGLGRIWRTQILPLLEERHLGEHPDVAAYVLERYGLGALLPRVLTGQSAPDVPSQPSDPDTAVDSTDATAD
ncbi:AAA family ATPase [Frankia sp. AgB1.9]|uniref:McrB family protein n=1 Tax=unclassified Frankia TaxID=2632575 RepID=UPI0019330BFA|nr:MULTISPECIES: AAA family ATPase [unclassified Frankia]MBL7492509.1 AAA family ATPase [Frankia sp. AgW1.1]MBL7547584.1 AAA family ATPase [Frankia sp. AgB1.9]MBL7619505.1 AAA family ATPase [Frankia sp. AgB1.8]